MNKKNIEQTQKLTADQEVKRLLFSSSKEPTRLYDVEHFKVLHRPRYHSLTEWLLQYENACKQQNAYTQYIKELRQQLQNHDNRKIHLARIKENKIISVSSFYWLSGIPLVQPDISFNQIYEQQKQHHKNKNIIKNNTREFLKEYDFPESPASFDYFKASDVPLNPKQTHSLEIPTMSKNASMDTIKNPKSSTLLPLNEDIDKKSDYEDIEVIALRNKLSLGTYF